jgi:hypothetical protein
MSIADFATRGGDFDIVLVNESGFVMSGFHPDQFTRIRQRGTKIVLIQHASDPIENRNPFSIMFDRVIVHERHSTEGFHFIPQGLPELPPIALTEPNMNLVGTNGFPLPHKNLPALAEAARPIGLHMMALMPKSGHAPADELAHALCTLVDPGVVTDTRWLSDSEMVYQLSGCGMVCYPYTQHTPGPSAASMLGILSRRPVILSRCSQFHHLFDYEDQFYWIESKNPQVHDIQPVLRRVKGDLANDCARYPTTVLTDYAWSNVTARYVALFREMLG